MMEKYLIISGTNRKDSNTFQVGELYQQVFKSFGINADLLSLTGLEVSFSNEQYLQIESGLLIPANKFIFITPEYNGSYPGVLKSMIDISDYKRCWWNKKALLVGISTGRAGNLLGMGHLTAVLHNLKMIVHPNQLPISSIHTLKNDQGQFADKATVKAIHNQVQEFVNF